MRVASSGAVFGLLMLCATTAWANCSRPRPAFEVPEGNSATAEQMAAVQTQVVAFTNEVAEYVRCLQGELGQKSIGKDDTEKAALTQTYATAHNQAADEVTGLVNCFNAHLDTFRSTGGGTQMRAADCSKFIAEAAANTSAPAQSVEELIVEASGHRFDVDTGSWRYFLARDDTPRACGTSGKEECLYRAVIVTNESNETLECVGEVTYEGTDITGKKTTRSQALVAERTSRIVASGLAKREINASVFNAECTAREKLRPLDTPANCKYEVVQPIAIADYYPPASRQAGEEGPVTVEFTLRGKAANPTNVKVAASSLFPALDAAAVKAVSDMVMSTNCPKTSYRLRVSFQLQ